MKTNKEKSHVSLRITLLTTAIVLASARIANATPVINSVSEISTQETQSIDINGSGFGTMSAYTGDSSYIELSDLTAGWSAGYNGSGSGDFITLIVNSWTDSQIALGGFSGEWGGLPSWVLSNGDSVQILVWNAQSGAGPASFTTPVGAVPLPASAWLLLSGLSGLFVLGRKRKIGAAITSMTNDPGAAGGFLCASA